MTGTDVRGYYKEECCAWIEAIKYTTKDTIAGDISFLQFDPDVFVNDNYKFTAQIPTFDVVLKAANEHGDIATMKIMGVQVRCSIDDLISKTPYRFTAKEIIPWSLEDTKEEDHTGQIYNPYTDKWSWL